MVFDTDIALDEIDRCKKESDGHEKETWLLKRIRQLEKENEELRQEIEERDFYDELEYERELYDREEGCDD